MPEVMSIMKLEGNADELMARMRDTIEPVAERKAPEYGGISSTVVKTKDGIMIVNLWKDEQGRHRMAEDPEIQQAIKAAGMPEPHAEGYEVVAHRTVS